MRLSIPFMVVAGVLGALSVTAPKMAHGRNTSALPSATTPDVNRGDLVRAADLALRGNRLIEARALLDTLDGLQPDGGQADDVALLRAEFLIATGHPIEARQLLETVGAEARERCRALAALAMADIQNRSFADAETQLRSAQGRCAEDPVFWRALGQASLGLGRSFAAVDAYRRALALDPDNWSVQNDLAVALIADGNAIEALGLLGAILRQAPDREDVAINLDYAGATLGRIPQRRSADNDAFWSRRLLFAGAGARSAGRLGLAEALYAQALMESPRHDETLWQQYVEAAQPR